MLNIYIYQTKFSGLLSGSKSANRLEVMMAPFHVVNTFTVRSRPAFDSPLAQQSFFGRALSLLYEYFIGVNKKLG